MDYIHGEETLKNLAEKEKCGWLFCCLQWRKESCFPYVTESGTLPRKTFSHGDMRRRKDIIWKQDRFADMTRKDKNHNNDMEVKG